MIATGSNRQQLVEENENYKKKKDKRKELAGSRPVSNRWVNAYNATNCMHSKFSAARKQRNNARLSGISWMKEG
ncbi:hypothetical protein [Gluconobacter sp. P5E10]|uniref:hypothetical protein n=1 Tax=Gluconobacter sp. P5E10 TaxID=2762613 RepID=UPI001C055AAA|nr:hypothetical protein [Gluconobacter sp. P5E10]